MENNDYTPRPRQGYPYANIARGVGGPDTLDGIEAAIVSWANAGWTLDYMVEAAEAGVAIEDARHGLALVGYLTGGRR